MSTQQFPSAHRITPIHRVAVGSTNPVKIQAATVIVRHYWPHAAIEGFGVSSGVPDQPYGDEQTIDGARQRAIGARLAGDADIGIGLEGGVVRREGGALQTCAWAVVAARDGRWFVGGSLSMPLPPAVAVLVEAGTELGLAMDAVTGAHETKHGLGAVGILTDGLIDRQRAYESLVAYALAPFIREDMWAHPFAVR